MADLNALKAEFYKFRDDASNKFSALNDALGRKADKQELAELEARIMDKLNEIMKNLFA